MNSKMLYCVQKFNMLFNVYKPLKNEKFQSHNIKFGILKSLLENIYKCYELMLQEHEIFCNHEECIRDLLLINYMKNPEFKHKICALSGFRFEREVPEDHKIITNNKLISGRTDIKVLPINGIDCDNDEAYFIIECKRLNNQAVKGTSGLNAEYIKNGILRFVSGQYKSYYSVNAMFGFIVSEIDIDSNIDNINYINKKFYANRIKTIQDLEAIERSKMYYSIHEDVNNTEISLLHLMMNFTK